MHLNNPSTGRCLLVILGLSIVLPVEGQIKCWTNQEGMRECGNAVPAEYAQQSYKEFSKQGVVLKQQVRAKTREELEEEKRLAEIKKNEELKAKERAQADRLLLDSFSNEDDMVLTRDGRISAVEAQIQVTQNHAKKLQMNLDQQIHLAAQFERQGKQPPQETVANIEGLRRQIDEAQAFVTLKRKEQEAIRRQFEADLERFRELMAERQK